MMYCSVEMITWRQKDEPGYGGMNWIILDYKMMYHSTEGCTLE